VLGSDHNEPMLAAVAAGEYDAAIVGLGAQPVPPGVGARVVATEPLVLAAPRGHPLARRRAVAIADLREVPLLTLIGGSGLRTLLEQACREAGFAPRITAETAELSSLVELVAEGVGVGVTPLSAAGAADVAVVRISRPRLQRRTALAWHAASRSPAARAFLAIAERRFSRS
jgi:DNA-binding transcriptional LysR family regulator